MNKTLNQKFVKCYSEKFEETKYPYEPYKKLVWDGIKLNNKYSILGAWKTGCIKTVRGEGYKSFDFEVRKYYYTRRWKYGTPAQKRAWEKLNASILQSKLQRLSSQVLFNKPTAFNEIKGINGLGFVYALFVLHCENPKLFPLYDQHVWRSYLYFTKGHYRSVKVASQSWSSYELYSKWFINQLKALGNIDPTTLDRALWAFGKELKKE
jgi:hypothetical protein